MCYTGRLLNGNNFAPSAALAEICALLSAVLGFFLHFHARECVSVNIYTVTACQAGFRRRSLRCELWHWHRQAGHWHRCNDCRHFAPAQWLYHVTASYKLADLLLLLLLFGRQEGHPVCKKKPCVGLLVAMIWLELCTTYSSSCHYHFHHYFNCISFAIRLSGRKVAIKLIDWLITFASINTG